eukprot:SAG25_NODE_284_length_10400_cov_5.110475_9_plen_77_part_00
MHICRAGADGIWDVLSNQQCVDFVRLKLSLALGVVVCARLSRLASPRPPPPPPLPLSLSLSRRPYILRAPLPLASF